MGGKTWIFLMWVLLFLGNVKQTFAQPNQLNNAFEDGIYQKAILMLEFLQKSDNQIVANANDMQPVEDLLEYAFMESDTLDEQLLKERLKANQKEYGLSFSARYTHNGERADETLEPGSRWRAGVEWDVLNDGWWDRKRKTKALKNEQQLFELNQDLQKRIRNYPFVYNKIIFAFNQRKIDLLQQRIPFLESLLDVLTDLYYIHDVKYTEVLDVKKKLEESKAMLMTYQNFNQAFKRKVAQDTLDLEATVLPVIDINLDQLLNDTIHEKLVDQIVEAKKESIMLREENSTLPNLKVFGNYNMRTLNFGYDRSYGTFGAQLNVPLDFKKKEQRMIRYLEGEKVQQDADFVVYNNARELLNLYQEYNYKMKQYIEFLHSKARLEELLRVERVLLDYDKRGHSPLLALNYMDMIQAVETELVDIQQMMYLKLAQIAAKSHHADFMSCLSARTFEEVGKKLEGVRYVILQPSDLENFVFTTSYLQKNEFKTVVLTESVPASYFQKLKAEGFFVLVKNDPEFLKLDLQKVPVKKFHNRNHLEFWISSARRAKPKSAFLFERLGELIELERKNKQLVTN